MRLFLLGATGNSGRRVLRFALERGHPVTAFVRNQSKLLEILGRHLPKGLHVIAGDIDKSAELAGAMVGHDVVINAAGHVTEGDRFTRLVQNVIQQTANSLGGAAGSGSLAARRCLMFRVPISWPSTCRWFQKSMKRTAAISMR